MNPRLSAIQMTLLITILYLALTANLEGTNIFLGLLIGVGISALVRPRQLAIEWPRLPQALWALGRYFALLWWDMVKSALQVARLVLHPQLPIRPGIFAIETGCQSELGVALSAHAVSLTPGELAVGMDDEGVLYVHCLDVDHSPEYVAEAQTLRRDLLSKIFE